MAKPLNGFDVDAPLRTQLSSETMSLRRNEAKLLQKKLQKSWISRIFGSPQKVLLESILQGNLILSQVNHLKDLLYHILLIYL